MTRTTQVFITVIAAALAHQNAVAILGQEDAIGLALSC